MGQDQMVQEVSLCMQWEGNGRTIKNGFRMISEWNLTCAQNMAARKTVLKYQKMIVI